MARKKVEDAKYLTNAEAVKKSKNKYKAAKLKQIKLWVAEEAPEEEKAIRKYASRKPKTKAILDKLKGE